MCFVCTTISIRSKGRIEVWTLRGEQNNTRENFAVRATSGDDVQENTHDIAFARWVVEANKKHPVLQRAIHEAGDGANYYASITGIGGTLGGKGESSLPVLMILRTSW